MIAEMVTVSVRAPPGMMSRDVPKTSVPPLGKKSEKRAESAPVLITSPAVERDRLAADLEAAEAQEIVEILAMLIEMKDL